MKSLLGCLLRLFTNDGEWRRKDRDEREGRTEVSREREKRGEEKKRKGGKRNG